eukprot:7618810-Pyramimonas_sp.AAC.1
MHDEEYDRYGQHSGTTAATVLGYCYDNCNSTSLSAAVPRVLLPEHGPHHSVAVLACNYTTRALSTRLPMFKYYIQFPTITAATLLQCSDVHKTQHTTDIADMLLQYRRTTVPLLQPDIK